MMWISKSRQANKWIGCVLRRINCYFDKLSRQFTTITWIASTN